MRTFDYYFVPKTVFGVDQQTSPSKVMETVIFFGHRMQVLLYDEPKFLKDLGFVDPSDLQGTVEPNSPPVTFITMYSSKDIERLGLIGTFNIELVPEDPNLVTAPYGNKYSTTVSYSRTIPPLQVIKVLSSKRWTFTENGQGFIYKVKQGSIIEKRLKSNNPRYI